MSKPTTPIDVAGAESDYYLCGEPGMPTRVQWNAFRRGEAAHKRGAELADNPFLNKNLNNWWMMGWEHAAHPAKLTKKNREWQEYLDELDGVE